MLRRVGLRQAGVRRLGDTAAVGSTTLATSSERRALLNSQADAFVGPLSSDFYTDGITGSEGLSSPGFVGMTVNPLTSGRCGGGKISYSMTGAGGVGFIRPSIPFSPGLTNATVLVADATNDWFYIAGGGALTGVSNAGEIAICGLVNLGVIGATDAASNPYFYLGAVGATSTTRLLIKSWDTFNPKTTDTGVNLDINANAFHLFALGHRMGTLYVLYDGITVFTMPFCQIFNQWLTIFAGVPIWGMRTTTAAVNSINWDFLFARGQKS